jgi:hypothetical protein
MAEFTTSTILTTAQICDSYGTTAQLIITFTCKAGSSYLTADLSHLDAQSYGISVKSWGKLKWEYNLEDMLLVPGEISMVLNDAFGLLDELFFGPSIHIDDLTLPNYFNPKAKIEIRLNGITEYIGYVQEDGIDCDTGALTCAIKADPNTQILNIKKLYVDDPKPGEDQNINPFGYADSNYPVSRILEDIFKLVNPSISYPENIEIYQDWLFYGKTWNNIISQDITFQQLLVPAYPLFFDPGKGMSTVGDVLRKLAIDWCCFTGMVHSNRAFFKKLYSYGVSGTQTLGRVSNRRHRFMFNLVDYVEITTDASATFKYWLGTDTKLEGRSIRRNAFSGFYNAGESGNESIGPASNVNAQIGSEIFTVYQAKETALFSGAFKSNGALICEFWYNNRSDVKKNRIDVLDVEGVGYDFLKDFEDDGYKHQPIGLEKNLDTGISVFQALNMGVA